MNEGWEMEVGGYALLSLDPHPTKHTQVELP